MSFRKPAFVTPLVFLVVFAFRAEADPPQFPYQATVQTEEVEVRAGPSEDRYYATGRLTRGQQVTVHRHDRGGWYMISPPPGSFDWIDASCVERQGASDGVVIATGQSAVRAFVRYGSELSDDCSLFGRELAAGDRVRILGEQTLNTEFGPTPLLKIEPPAREYRWVKGDFIVAVDPVARREQDLDPYRIPSSQFNSLEYAEIVTASSTEPSVQTEESAALEASLGEIDLQYAEMMQLDPSLWNLDQLEQGYLALRTRGDVVFQGQVDQRLTALAARREIHNDVVRLQQIRDETTMRDQQLQAMQQQGGIGGFTPMPAQLPVELGAPASFPAELPAGYLPETAVPEAFPAVAPQVGDFTTPISDPSGGLVIDPAASAVTADHLCGAGILQEVQGLPAGQPTHALVSPDGRLLTLIVAEVGVSLDEHEGSQVGVVGQRSFDAQLQSDVTVVRQIVPVQLVP